MKYDEQTDEVKALIKSRQSLLEEIETLKRKISEIELKIVSAICPYRVGQRFNSISGSRRGQKQCEIVGIKFDEWDGFAIQIKKVKKNGEVFADKTYFFACDWDMENPIDPEGER